MATIHGQIKMVCISLGAAALRLFGDFFAGAVDFSHDTVDGWNLAPPGMYKTL